MSLLKIIRKRDCLFGLFFLVFIYPLAIYALGEPIFAFRVHGVEDPIKTSIESKLQSNLNSLPKPLSAPKILTLTQDNQHSILSILQAYGFYHAQVNKTLVHLNYYWEATYCIDPGPPILIRHVQIILTGEGAYEPYFRETLNKTPLKSGQVFTIKNYNLTKQLLFTISEEEGYLRAQLTQHTVFIDLAHNTADINLRFDTGPRYFFGPVHFNKTPLNEQFLQRFVPFKQGESYSATKILKFQESLANSNYFSDVSIQPDLSNACACEVPIQTQVCMRKKYQYTFGVGYGTDTGVRGLSGWDWRYVTDTGQQFSTLLQLSQVQQLISAIYSIPGAHPLTEQYNINASVFDNSLPQSRSETDQVGVNYVKTMDKWQQTIALNYQVVNFSINKEPYQLSRILTPSITWVYTSLDNLIFPNHAQKFSFRIQGASQNFLSDNNLLQLEAFDKFIYTFSPGPRVLLRGDVGYSVVDKLDSLPLTMQFIAGGTQSIRGYTYQSLGPGRYLTVGSIEAQQHLFSKLYAVGFYDIGNAYNIMGDSLMSGTGAGLMWASPIGPLELTLGKALSKPGEPTLVQFSMGPDL